MTYAELNTNGWYVSHDNGVKFRWNPDHIDRCRAAIRQRHENEVEIIIEPQKSKVVQLRKRVDKSA